MANKEPCNMDPQATLNGLLEALDDADWDSVRELAMALQHWLDHDGFPPVTMGAKSLGREWHMAIVVLLPSISDR